MVSFRQTIQAICLFSVITLGQAKEAQRSSRNVGYSKLYNRDFVNHALLPRQSSCDSGYQLCADGECALASDSCCNGGGSCHQGYTCYGIGSAGGCCPNGQTCSGPGVGCTGTDVECLDGCHPAGYNCNSAPTAVATNTPTTPSGSTPTSVGTGSGCLSSEKVCGGNFCIPSNGICCGDGYYCDPGYVCKSTTSGTYKCGLGGSSAATSSLGLGGFSSSTGSSGTQATQSAQSFSNFFTATSLVAGGNPTATGRVGAASGLNANVYSGLAGIFMVLLGL